MTQITIFQILTLIVTAIAAIAAWAAFVRAGRWRDSDDGKAVKEDIHTIKNELAKINGRLSRAEEVDKGLPTLVDRVTRVETAMESVATTADFRELSAEVDGIAREVKSTLAGVSRIEGWLVEGRGQ
jgi:hypothetical protein